MIFAIRRLPARPPSLVLAALAILLAGAVACSGSGSGLGNGTGAMGSAAGPLDPRCERARATIEGLYRAEATAASLEAARVEEAVRDNTAMVIAECARRPQVATCAGKARTALQLESSCLEPLDDEGTEGSRIRR